MARGPLVALALVLAVASGGCGERGAAAAPEPGDPGAPNFVIVETDDQSVSEFHRRVMPRTFRLLVARGTTFTQSLAAPPRCCPSRAGLLSGQYPHNHGILWNRPAGLTQAGSTLPAWLADEGYRTALFGKFLNGYVTEENPAPAPGFSDWFALSAEGEPSYTSPVLSDGERLRTFRDRYLTNLLNRRAVDFVKDAGAGPFFLWQTQYAPHARGHRSGPCRGFAPEPLPRDYRAFAHAPPPRGPAYDEADVSDKPRAIASLPRLDAPKRAQAKRNYRCSLASLRTVDRGVGELAGALKRSGELADTLFVFTSDNGMFFGEHRLAHGKVEPYEESIRVPLVIRAGRHVLSDDPPARIDELVAQIDLAPTLAELAGADTCSGDECRTVDGRSLVGLLEGRRADYPSDRGILLELKPPGECGYGAIRTPDLAYVERRADRGAGCETRELELYDLTQDPYELENLAASKPGLLAEPRARLADLVACSGAAGEPGAGGTPCE